MCESTTPAVQCTKYDEFMDKCRGICDIVWAPLRPDVRVGYNATAALEFFRTVEGMDYGFRTLLWGWIDDAIANMPCLPPDFASNCATWSYFEASIAELDRHTDLGRMIWNPGLAKRLGVDDTLRTAELYQIAWEQGISTLDLIRMPEQDSWLYNTTRYGQPNEGKDMVCDVFVCNMWKAGGLFGNMESDINCGEMTNWDVYVLDFLDSSYVQIMGNYSLKLQFDYNSKSPYPHMAEDCSAAPPDYEKDPHC
ncbi:unnamed protein product [Symbiodinium microadriaticum]|nr:unnamed protein product [Symbiodinium microadriaticum]